MVFEHLPLLSVDKSTQREMDALHRVNVKEMAAHHHRARTRPMTSKRNGCTRRPAQLNANGTGITLRIAGRSLRRSLSLETEQY